MAGDFFAKLISEPSELVLTGSLLFYLWCLRTFVANKSVKHSAFEAASHIPLDIAFASLTFLVGFVAVNHNDPKYELAQLFVYICLLFIIRHCQRLSEDQLGEGAYKMFACSVSTGFCLSIVMLISSIYRMNSGGGH